MNCLVIDKPEAKSQSQSNPLRQRGIWPLGLSLKSNEFELYPVVHNKSTSLVVVLINIKNI